MGRSTDKETRLSEQRKYRSWTAQQKLEIVLAGMRGDRSVRDVCREHGIAETLYYGGGATRSSRLAARRWRERRSVPANASCAARSASSSGRSDARPTSWRSREIASVGVSVRVAHALLLVAQGEALASVARVLQISRQAVHRTPKPRRSPQRRPVTDPVDVAIVEMGRATQQTATGWSAASCGAGSASWSTASESCG